MNITRIGKRLLPVIACLICTISRAQSPFAAAPQFEVASIKLHQGIPNLVHLQPLPGGRLVVENFSFRLLMQTAYALQSFQVTGGPDWINSDRYDIQAKADGNPSSAELTGPLLQKLLEARFKLSFHHETRLLPVYELTVAKGGIKMQRAREGGCIPISMASPSMRPMRSPGDPSPTYCGFLGFGVEGVDRKLEMAGVNMSELATTLSRDMQAVVINKTGLAGTFDVKMHWTSADVTPQTATNLTSPSIFTAIDEQLGLKLESAKGPVDVLVIDHVEKPSAN